MSLNSQQEQMCSQSKWDFSDLKALFLNCTLKKSPELSHTQGLIDISVAIMQKNRIEVECLRPVDYDIASGVWPDMTEHGWDTDEWPGISEKVMAADILVIGTSIWLGEKTSVATKVIERLYATSHLLNNHGQYAYYGRVGGCLITGNEDGGKHCAMNILYSLQHLGYVIPPTSRCRLARRGGPGPIVSRPRLRRTRERLHESQYHVHDVEPDAHGPHDQRRRRHPGARQPTLRMGRRLPQRFRESRVSVAV